MTIKAKAQQDAVDEVAKGVNETIVDEVIEDQQVTDEGVEGQSDSVDELHEEVSSMRQFVTFITGDEVFAVDMEPVQEIIRVPTVVRVPLAPSTLEGLANLRGKVLPIISLRRVFGFDEHEYDDLSRAIVIDLGQPLGFVVDRVDRVIGVEISQIESVDSIRGTVDTDLLTGLLKNVGGHAMVMVLDFAKLIANEFAEMAKLSIGSATQSLSSSEQKNLDIQFSEELQLE